MGNEKETINRICDTSIFSFLELHFARFITDISRSENVSELFLAAALLSRYQSEGHICLDLSAVQDADVPIDLPELNDWCEKLRKSGVVGTPGEYKPLILDHQSRLYLYRYWEYQENLATHIRTRVVKPVEDVNLPLLGQGLRRLFPKDPADETDWQEVAAFSALTQKFCVISGGPGTGKTTTVSKILTLLLEQNPGMRIALAAPTGKAAARLQEAIVREKEKLPREIREILPETASTLHRLLGSIPNSPYFRHNAKNPLPADVLVIDEASMVDMALMSKLIQALPRQARLILLGDKDQLASVEAGAVLGDICEAGNLRSFSHLFRKDFRQITGHEIRTPRTETADANIADCIVQLQQNYRFGGESGIGAVSHAVNAGDAKRSRIHIRDETYGDISWKMLPQPDELTREMSETVVRGFSDYLQTTGDPQEVFELFDRFRILCALRRGPYGATAINGLVEQMLRNARLISARGNLYPGRPVLITRNDYQLRLFNGDVGIILRDPEAGGELRVFFPTSDGPPRKLHHLRLPEHETVYAMTVHKSQGSEFDKVLLILPDMDVPVLTRELVYTGITRGRSHVEIWGNENVFHQAVSRGIHRTSGLRDALWDRHLTDSSS